MSENFTANQAWEKIFDKYDIVKHIEEKNVYHITAKQIKEFKEPRLMAKWDSCESLPKFLYNKRINILPDSRGSYILGRFSLYENLPKIKEKIQNMTFVELNHYETIDIENISSEASAINVLNLSGALNHFLNEDDLVQTFNGRMSTGIFNFSIDTDKGKENIYVKNAQCEIDAGLESSKSIVIMEAKNIIYPDFHIRQLYYPYRLWQTKVNKPIRLVFSVYSNQIYRLLEYGFNDLNNYNSIILLKEKSYSLQDTNINLDDIIDIFKKIKRPLIDDSQDNNIKSTPFVQADSFERVISLLEHFYNNPVTPQELAEYMQFTIRQSDYYFNAGKYLGLFDKEKINGQIYVSLTKLGVEIYKMKYKERQLKLVELILEHEIFYSVFKLVIDSGRMPDKNWVIKKMKELNVCNDELLSRRSSSVISWTNWILDLSKL